MYIKLISNRYHVRKSLEEDVPDIYRLCCGNSMYYEYCPPFVTEKRIKEDMVTFPPNTTIDDKYYVGFYDDNKLIAVMDLINGYPEDHIAFIGFFMTDSTIQGKGIGSNIISHLCSYLKSQNYNSIRLAWIKGNPQAEHFWLKNEFIMIRETLSTTADSVILAERFLQR